MRTSHNRPMPRHPSKPRLAHALALSLLTMSLLIAGCAGPGGRGGPSAQQQQQRQQVEARVQALSASGYQPAESATLTMALQQWIVLGETVPVSLAFAGSGRALPLIVYLP